MSGLTQEAASDIARILHAVHQRRRAREARAAADGQPVTPPTTQSGKRGGAA